MRQRRWNGIHLLGAAVAAGLSLILGVPIKARAHTPPKRIVSLNVCTDQLVMLLAGPERIAALSHLARDPQVSVLAEQAKDLPINYGQAEEVFLLKPDLIVAGSFQLNATVDILRRLGQRVEEFPGANSFADIRDNLRRMGRLLGAEAKAERLISELDSRLARLPGSESEHPALAALYYANSYTSGSGTLAAEVVERAGFANLGSTLGLKGTAALPLELLIMNQPDFVVTGLSYSSPALAQEVLEHPALNYLAKRTSKSTVEEKFWICGAPFTVQAAESLAEERKRLSARSVEVNDRPHVRVAGP